MNFLNTIEIKQLPRNSRVALEERANRVPQEFQTMTIDQGKQLQKMNSENIYIYIYIWIYIYIYIYIYLLRKKSQFVRRS